MTDDPFRAALRHLPSEERELFAAGVIHGMSASDSARALGTTPEVIRARVCRIRRRVASPRFLFVVARWRDWPEPRRLVAQEHVLGGRSIRETARRLSMTVHEVRRHIGAIDTLFQDSSGAAAPR